MDNQQESEQPSNGPSNRTRVYTPDDLERRMKLVIKEVKAFPTDSEDLDLDAAPSLREVPYWSELLDSINAQFGSLQSFYESRIPRSFLTQNKVPFPSPEQDEAVTQMAENPRLLIRDTAGAGKTILGIKAKYALEQLVLNNEGKRLNTVVIAPNYVLSSWQSKLKQYHPENSQPRVLRITSASREEALRQLEENAGKDIDFTLISYDALFRTVNGHEETLDDEKMGATSTKKQELEEQMIRGVPVSQAILKALKKTNDSLMLVVDECHNAKNPDALRSRSVRELALAADFFYPLSGNPFPDNLEDIGETASLLDNEHYPTAEDFNRAYENNPRLIRMFLKRFSKEPVVSTKDIAGMPSVKFHEPINVSLSRDELDLYYAILNHREFDPGTQLALLRLSATDGKLLANRSKSEDTDERIRDFFANHPEIAKVAERIDSSKYKAVDGLVDKIAAKDEKAVVWSVLREGITTTLEQRYAKHGSIRIDGTVSADPGNRRYSDRDIARLTFQTNPDIHVMIGTLSALREGQDLHAANHGIFIQKDPSPGHNDQGVAREFRRGQTREVHIYNVIATGTVDQGYTNLEEGKREGIVLVDKMELSKEQTEMLSRDRPIVKQAPMQRYMMNSHSLVRFLSGPMINMGAKENIAFLSQGDNARLYAQAYNFMWDYSYSAHTANLIAQLVKEQEESKALNLTQIADLGSGPATVSRKLRRPTSCFDINPFQLSIGKEECARLGIDIKTERANIEDLPNTGDSNFDLAIMSLALHYGNSESGGRKRMILEANRIVKEGGYVILTLPPSILQGEGRELLEEGLNQAGLEKVNERTGFVHALDGVEKDYRVYLGLFRKTHGNSRGVYLGNELDKYFVLNPNFFYRGSVDEESGEKREGPGKQGYNMEVCTRFMFENGDEINIERKIAPKVVRKTPEQIAADMIEFLGRRHGRK